ncbi:MAG: metallophosphoesterase [Candidatus Hydrogenedentota bacterium]
MWRFLQISDLHFGDTPYSYAINYSMHRQIPEIMHCLRKDAPQLEPDFLVATGDLTNQGGYDAVFAGRDLLDFLDLPYYPLGGDADFRDPESRTWFIEAYSGHLPLADTVYSFTHKNLHFCVLDPWRLWPDGSLAPIMTDEKTDEDVWAIPPHQLHWLEDDLRSHQYIATVVLLHYPVLPIPERVNPYDHGNRRGRIVKEHLLLDLLANHEQVKLLLTGHTHYHCIRSHRGLTEISTGAMVEYPVEYRDFHVYDDRIEVYTHGLSEGRFAQQSLIEGREWPSGSAGDRENVIALD